MLRKPFADLGMPVRGIVVDDRVDRLSLGNVRVNLIEEADEFLMPMALHVAADNGAVENIERGEQRGRAVALVIVRHRSGATRLHRQSRLGAIESLDLALLVDREDDGVGGRVDIETDHIPELVGELGSFDSLNVLIRCGASWWASRMRCTDRKLIPTALASIRPVQ